MIHRVASLFVAASLLVPATVAQDSASGAAPSAADVNREFDELDALLGQMPEAFGQSRVFCGPDPGSELAARLAVFPARFGQDPRRHARWKELEDHASAVLAGEGLAGLGPQAHVSAQMDRYVLDDILGREEEAAALLAAASPRGSDACLGCSGLASNVVNQRRSEDAERRGDAERGLRLLHESVFDLAAVVAYYGPMCEPGLPATDILLARYGLLLIRTGHADVGQLVLQDLLRTRPDTIGAWMARAELSRRDARAGTERARFASGIVDGAMATTSCIVVAVWNADDPKSMRWIAARLPGSSVEQWSRTVAFDPEGFQEVRGHIASGLSTQRPALDALTFANGLAGGAEPWVDHFLETMRSDTRWPLALMQAADERLRWMHGGGPELDVPLGRCDGRALCEEWKAWRRASGAKADARR